jgi:predicted lactoylglutathione lyase
MATKLFVNLPVENLDQSKDFFARLGFSFNPQFTDENAACMVIGEDNYAMLLTKPFFKNFIKKPIADARQSAAVIVSLSAESKEQVDDLVDKAIAAGGTATLTMDQYEGMYGRGFEDLDGHLWEYMYMDPAAITQG